MLRPLPKQMLRSHRNQRLVRRRKLKKALADANKERTQREQAMTERLRTMSATAEGKHFALSFISTPFALLYLLILFFPFFLCPLLLCRI
jgi:hypothetical protein